MPYLWQAISILAEISSANYWGWEMQEETIHLQEEAVSRMNKPFQPLNEFLLIQNYTVVF